ncbi:hypothetical protein F5Y13DRAFT_199197 [Hypoxylon sp. FL1857]|nr:hypothetical protein F5Y13DRAFT_199197 [Hypoxylon sp. FL1857]
MAAALSSYDKVDHLKTHFGDWEALSIHEADPICSEDSSFQSDSEGNDDFRSLSNSNGRSSTLGNHYDLSASTLDSRRRPGSSANSTPVNVAGVVPKKDKDESSATQKHQDTGLLREYSTSGSTTSFATGSTARDTSSRPPLSPTDVVGADTSKPVVRFTDRGPPRALAKRPAVSRRSSANAVPVAEWGTLFDEKGYATVRNREFLKGVAKHVIDDLAPSNNNLVVTPDKLSALYSKYRIDSEVYPFTEIFNSRARDVHDRLADFYTDLDCQYHLVQPDSYSRPRVPALTPTGFAQFLTTCILAHPDEEFRRLDKIVTNVQVVADGEPEKLPRQLLRSQFPVRHNPKSRKVLAAALDDLMYDLRLLEPSGPKSPLAIMPPPPSSERRNSMPIAGVRHYMPPEKIYARKDVYALPASSETGKANGRYILPSPKAIGDGKTSTTPADTQDRDGDRDGYYEQARSRYTEEPESYEPDSSTAARERQHRREYASASDLHLPPARSVAIARASQAGPLSATARTVHVCSYPSAGPGCSTTSVYIPTSTSASTATYRRAQSPPVRTYRASMPDVGSSSANYYKPAGYLPPASSSGSGDRRDHAASIASMSSSAIVNTRSGNADSGRASSGGLIESGPSTAMTVRGSSSSSGTSKAPASTSTPTTTTLALPSSSSSSAVPNATQQQHSHSSSHSHSRSHSRQDSTGSKRANTAPLLPPATMNTGEKKHHNHNHHHHRRRRSAVVTIDDDRGPTWEEVLKAQSSHHHRSGSSSKSSHHHHRRHHSGH